MALSSTAIRPGGIEPSRPSAAGTSTSSVWRSRAFTPMISPSVSSTRSRSRSECVSRSGSIPSARVAVSIRSSSPSSRQAAISKTQSAPAARDSTSWSGSIRKSFRSTGMPAVARTSRRSARDPPKCRGSVRTEIAAAPPASYARASDAGSASASIQPALGDERFTSAITAGTVARRSASRSERAGGRERAAASSASSGSGRSSSSRRIVPTRSVRNPIERGSLPARHQASAQANARVRSIRPSSAAVPTTAPAAPASRRARRSSSDRIPPAP